MLNIDFEELKCEAHYKNACDLLLQKSISSVNSAISEFNKISGYKDVEAKLAEAENVLNELNENIYKRKKKRNKLIITTAIIVCVCLVFGVVLKSVIIPSVKYHSEQKQIEFVQEQLKSVSVGDKVRFGTYEQDNDISNGKEDIEWRVLAKENNRILVISDKALDCQLYNVKYDVVTWKTCTLRKWLNDDFFNSAFTDAEKMCIPTVTVSADKNPKYSTYSGKTTKDKIFLLSTKEAEKYFVDDEERKCIPTDYAIAQGVYTSDNHTINGVGTCYWWLRSPGSIQSCATLVYDDGVFSERGYDVDRSCSAVRPAMWITIE